MRIIDVEQKTTEWFAARGGRPTASCFDKLLTTKGEQSKSRIAYMYKLAAEKVSGVFEEGYQSFSMMRGNEVEEEARRYYEFTHGVEVQRVGFCVSDCDRYGCSPDGLVGTEGGLQIKCPEAHTHVKYLLDPKLPTDYFQQVQGELYVTGRKWWDFLSYYPGLKPLLIRVTPDAQFHQALGAELNTFCLELEQVIGRIS